FDAESQFGHASTGTHMVVSALFTLAVFRPRKLRLKDGRSWSEGELDAFFDACARTRCDPFVVLGSWTGAMGIVQFEPSSYEKFAMHYDGASCVDGRLSIVPPDLSNMDDAVCSVGNYLFHNHWGARE